MTKAQQVARAYRELSAECDEGQHQREFAALADVLEAGERMRNEHGKPPMTRVDVYDDAMARLHKALGLEVDNG